MEEQRESLSIIDQYFIVLTYRTVNALKYGHGRIFFNCLFWKKLFNKNAINSHFSFFGLIMAYPWPYFRAFTVYDDQ
jgi:hypothetical protein